MPKIFWSFEFIYQIHDLDYQINAQAHKDQLSNIEFFSILIFGEGKLFARQNNISWTV